MDEGHIEYCVRKIAEEEGRASSAPSPEAAELHLQKVRLYRAQLAILRGESWSSAA